jgi:hypothetical protein
MKGVVVSVDSPHSVVLFNNGRIGAIPTPPGCTVGMIVMVNVNRKRFVVSVMTLIMLVGLGYLVWFVLHNRSISPEQFCAEPFLRKDIVMPDGEYDSYDALFAHVGQPLREFSAEYPKSQHKEDRVRSFNYQYYGIVTYYASALGTVNVLEIHINTVGVAFKGDIAMGDDRSVVEDLFKAYMTGKGRGVLFAWRNNDMQFTMEGAVLLFKFNNKNKLAGIEIKNSQGR